MTPSSKPSINVPLAKLQVIALCGSACKCLAILCAGIVDICGVTFLAGRPSMVTGYSAQSSFNLVLDLGVSYIPLPLRRKSGFVVSKSYALLVVKFFLRFVSVSVVADTVSSTAAGAALDHSDSYFQHPVAITAAAATQIPAFIIFFIFLFPSILSQFPRAPPIFRVTRA